jgi:hypothetical protein
MLCQSVDFLMAFLSMYSAETVRRANAGDYNRMARLCQFLFFDVRSLGGDARADAQVGVEQRTGQQSGLVAGEYVHTDFGMLLN